MRLFKLSAAIALVAGSFGLTATAEAQHHDNRPRVERSDHRGYRWGDSRRYHRPSRHEVRRHRDYRRPRHCRTEWRHHRRIRVCR